MVSTPFDIFLSHNSRDKPAVERIAILLKQTGFTPWLDAWDLPAGGDWQDGIERGLRHSRGCAVFLGSHGFGDWQLQEMKVASSMAAHDPAFRYFLVLLPGAPDPLDSATLPAFINLRGRVNLREGFAAPRQFQHLTNAILGVAMGPSVPIEPELTESPYRGLEAFDAEHAEFFFGRDAEIRKLLDKLRDAPLLAVIGPSGSGKSSLVLAGLIPALRNGRLEGSADWPIVTLAPGAHPVESLAVALDPLDPERSRNRLLKELQGSPWALRLESAAVLKDRPRDAKLVLVVDQFEEIFTLCRDDAERTAFLGLLLEAAQPEGRCIVIITMRADFYPRITEYPALAEQVESHQLLVGALTKEGLTAAIEQPAFRKGFQFEPGLVSTILADVGSDAGALPLLQYALDELWKRQHGGLLTLEGYRASGGVGEAIATRANRVFEQLSPDQQAVARRVLLRLTQPGESTEDTRRRAELNELVTRPADRPAIEAAINALVAARLLTASRDEVSGAAQVDVAHEALIRAWPRLRQWLDEDRQGLLVHRRLTEAAHEWQRAERDPDLLYRGSRLTEALALASLQPDALNELEREFLAESAALRERERAAAAEAAAAQERLRRRILTGLGAFSAVALLLALLAGLQWREAGRQAAEAMLQTGIAEQQTFAARTAEDEAQRQAAAAENAEATAQAEAARAETEAARAEREAEVARTAEDEAQRQAAAAATAENAAQAEARVALSRQLAAQSGLNLDNPGLASLLAAEAYALNPDDLDVRRALFAAANELPNLKSLLHGQQGAKYVLAFSPDSTVLASGNQLGSIVLWDPVTMEPIGPPIVTGLDGVWQVEFSAGGRYLAYSTFDSTIQVWNLAAGKAAAPPITSEHNISALALSPNGSILAAAGDDGTIELWNAMDGQPVGSPLLGHEGVVYALDFNADGSLLVSGGYADSTVIFWDVGEMHQIGTPLDTGQNGVTRLVLSPDGATLYTAGSDGTVRPWDVVARSPIGEPLAGDGSEFMSLAMSQDGTALAAGSYDGEIWQWDVASSQPIGQTVAIGQGPVMSLALNGDGSLLASGGLLDPISLWTIARPHVPLFLPLMGNLAGPSAFAFSPDGATIATGSNDGEVILWDAATGVQRGPPLQVAVESNPAFNTPSPTISTLSFSPDGSLLATGRTDGVFSLWDVETRIEVWPHRVFLDGQPFWDLAFSPEGEWLAIAGGDGSVQLWSVKDLDTRHVLIKDPNLIFSLAFNSDGTVLAAPRGDGSGVIEFWDVETQQPTGETIETGQNAIGAVEFVMEDSMIATAGGDGTVRTWNFPDGSPAEDAPFTHEVARLATNEDGSLIVALSADGIIELWPVGERSPAAKQIASGITVGAIGFSSDNSHVAFFTDDENFGTVLAVWDIAANAMASQMSIFDNLTTVALSADGSRVAAGSKDGTFAVWDTVSRETIFTRCVADEDGVWRIAFSADGSHLATSSGLGDIRIWDIAARSQVGAALQGHDSTVSTLAFNSDGSLLASGDTVGAVRIWDVQSGQAVGEPFVYVDPSSGQAEYITALAFSPGSNRSLLAVVGRWTIALWDIEQQQFEGTELSKQSGGFSQIAFSRDGELLAYTDGLGGIDVWDTTSQRYVGPQFVGEFGPISGLAFSPDSTLLSKGSGLGIVQVWDVAGESLLGDLQLTEQGVEEVAFSSDGSELIAVDHVGTRGRWPVSVERWLARACQVANRNLTLAEWQRFIGDPDDPRRPYRKTCQDLPGPSDEGAEFLLPASASTPVLATPVASDEAA